MGSKPSHPCTEGDDVQLKYRPEQDEHSHEETDAASDSTSTDRVGDTLGAATENQGISNLDFGSLHVLLTYPLVPLKKSGP